MGGHTIILAFNGCRTSFEESDGREDHDAAATLMIDGVIVAACEQERFDRLKHSSRSPIDAIRYCLGVGGIKVSDLTYVCFPYTQSISSKELLKKYKWNNARVVVELFKQEGLGDLKENQIKFLNHHACHAASALYFSRFNLSETLTVTIDGQGDREAVSVNFGEDLKRLQTYRFPDFSLGAFYTFAIQVIGFQAFDEYKVMGLAPYGDPSVFREDFKNWYELLPSGGFLLKLFVGKNVTEFFEFWDKKIGSVFNEKKELTEEARNYAASLQEVIEVIMLHLLSFFQERSGAKFLCLAGGVSHNCSMNGKILYSNIFKGGVWVQPAAHDSGTTLGAAALIHKELTGSFPTPTSHVYFGPDIGPPSSIEQELDVWSKFLSIQKEDDLGRISRLLAEGKVIGWIQGRSEFGPRALGNRSILADPRPASHKDLINLMVKKREAFRPFAPSILLERFHTWFDVPENVSEMPYMTFVVNVKEEKQSILGAVTHVDGTARVQTVDQIENPKYWELISRFEKETGVPILLNTSFNNNVEPIVNTLHEAIQCYLTTGLDLLVVDGTFVVQKEKFSWDTFKTLYCKLSKFCTFLCGAQVRQKGVPKPSHRTRIELQNYALPKTRPRFLSRELGYLLSGEEAISVEATFQGLKMLGCHVSEEKLMNQLLELWSDRLIVMHPLGF
jgi:carbamoyltransferase